MLREAVERKASFWRQWKMRHGLAHLNSDYRAKDIADLMRDKSRVEFGQTIRLPWAAIYARKESDDGSGISHLILKDRSMELKSRLVPENYNIEMGETLGRSMESVAYGERIHALILARGIKSIYTPLTEDYPFYLVGFMRQVHEKPGRAENFDVALIRPESGGLFPEEL